MVYRLDNNDNGSGVARNQSKNMKHLTKPIRAINFLVLAFLMTLSSPVAAQDFQKGHVAYEAGDYATAIKQWMPLAEAGDALAQNSLGFMYQIGRGVPQDYQEALKWYRLAAEQDYAKAQSHLGIMYGGGYGVPQDDLMAHMWHNISAANGDLVASPMRDIISIGMTPADISKAQAMARECMNSGYTKCGY